MPLTPEEERTHFSNVIAQDVARNFLVGTAAAGMGFGERMTCLETTITKIVALITLEEKPPDAIRFATGIADQLVEAVHIRVVQFLKEHKK